VIALTLVNLSFMFLPLKTEPSIANLNNGILILDRVQSIVKQQLIEKNWAEVERWLLEANSRINGISRPVIEQNLIGAEKDFWRVEVRPYNIKSGYRLDLFNIWTGFAPKKRRFYLKKSCQIKPTYTTDNMSKLIPSAVVVCTRRNQLFQGVVPAQQ
jgi:hypothetical protein